jgi:ubiquinone/menaquinone biosynthesis C-methylase UbiE
MSEQEKYRTYIKWLLKCRINIPESKLLEIGCGCGNNILDFIRLGFKAKNITVNELIESRMQKAKEILPGSVQFIEGNAAELKLKAESYDIVYQSMVFSSILSRDLRESIAEQMWRWVKPGGGVLWYDFIYNNPSNKDVTGIPVHEFLKMFPGSEYYKWKITLAPPLSRLVTKIHPVLYPVFNTFKFLRTHYLIYVRKAS